MSTPEMKSKYEYLEIPASDEKNYLAQGWFKCGMRRDTNDRTFVKLRRERKSK